MSSSQMALLLPQAVEPIYRLLHIFFFSHLCIFFMKEKRLGHEFIDLGEANHSKKNFSGCNT